MNDVTTREELPDLPFRRFRARPNLVTAVQLTEPLDIPNPFASGGTFHGEPGDWKITYGYRDDGTPDEAICDRDIFEKTYEQVRDNHYCKRTTTVVEAAQIDAPIDIVTLEGPSRGKPGDWLILGVEGEPYFNADAYFRRKYELLTDQS